MTLTPEQKQDLAPVVYEWNMLREAAERVRSAADSGDQVLKNLVDQDERRVSIEHIQRLVCQYFSISLAQLKSKNNSHAISYPRQIAMYLSKQMTPASLPQIGRQFGGKHHTTVLHSINKIGDLRKSDRDLNRLIHKLSDNLQ